MGCSRPLLQVGWGKRIAGLPRVSSAVRLFSVLLVSFIITAAITCRKRGRQECTIADILSVPTDSLFTTKICSLVTDLAFGIVFFTRKLSVKSVGQTAEERTSRTGYVKRLVLNS